MLIEIERLTKKYVVSKYILVIYFTKVTKYLEKSKKLRAMSHELSALSFCFRLYSAVIQ